MKMRDCAWACFITFAGVAAAVLVVGFLAGCAAPVSKKTISPWTPEPAKEMVAASAASAMPDTGLKASAQAPAAKHAGKSASHQKAQPHKLWGIVQSFDVATGKLVFKDRNGWAREFKVTAKAKVTKGGDFMAIALSDMKQGDHITLGYAGTAVESVHVNVLPLQSGHAVATNDGGRR